MEKTGKYYIKLGLPEGTSFPSSPVEGDLFWRSDENFAYVYTGSAWRQLDAFIDATDTPGTYTGSGGYKVVVKDNETGLEFIPTLSGEVEAFTDLTDTPSVYTGSGGYVVAVKDKETGLEFSPSVSGELSDYMLNLDRVLIVHPAGDTRTGQFYNTIAAAYSASSNGDTILVMPGTYTDKFTVTKNISIIGLSRDQVIIEGDGSTAGMLTLSGGTVLIANLTTSQNGSINNHRGIEVTGATATIINCVIDITTSAATANGVVCVSGTLNIVSCDISASGASSGRAVSVSGGSVELRRCKASGSSADLFQVGGTLNEYLCEYNTEFGTIGRLADIRAKFSEYDVSNPPTDVQLDSAFGTPASVGDGFVGLLDDAGAENVVYLCVAKGATWWYATLTKAV